MKAQIKPSKEYGRKPRKYDTQERNLNNTDRRMAIKDQQED